MAQPAGPSGNPPAVPARTYNKQQILDAMQQGALYGLSPLQTSKPPKRGGRSTKPLPLHQVAGSQEYPHRFLNSGPKPAKTPAGRPAPTPLPVNPQSLDNVNPLTDLGCNSNMNEFPIMPNGDIFQGPAVKGPQPGLDRVLFAWDPVNKATSFCGVMTHGGKINNAFQDCT